MNKVLCFGEVLIDFLQVSSEAQPPLTINDYRQFPGGAPANAAVALAKLGGNARFIGQVGNDLFGQFLLQGLADYGVDTQYCLTHKTAPTPLAFVHLDENGERSFTFLRKQSADLQLNFDDLDSACINAVNVFHFCSNTLTEPNIATTTQAVLRLAEKHQITRCFDVNLRHNLWPAGQAERDLVNQFVHQAHVVKFAREEFDYLCRNNPQQYIAECFDAGCQIILITNGAHQIEYYTPSYHGVIQPPKTKVVDTTAGGDGFIGAMLYLLSTTLPVPELLSSQDAMRFAVAFASTAGAIAVSTQGAFPALPTMEQTTRLFSTEYTDPIYLPFIELLTRELL